MKQKMIQTSTSRAKPSEPAQEIAEYRILNLSAITYSPLNYRKVISEEQLRLFAEEIALHGVISPVTVRPLTHDTYELVAGERRFRASQLAGLPTIPAVVKMLTDEEVVEIQLAENIQRENPHPLHEAQAIGQLLTLHKKTEEIAARLGRTKAFVYSRKKLLSLIVPFQEVFLADAINIAQAMDVASLTESSQQDVFAACCTNWQKKKQVSAHDLAHYVDQCRYDLKNAPFSTKSKQLLADVGACTNCSFNSATVKFLFPELAKTAICSNKSCYERKCAAHWTIQLTEDLQCHQPEALIFYQEPSEAVIDWLELVPAAAALPRHLYATVNILWPPAEPDSGDHLDTNGELHQESLGIAVKEYEEECAAFNGAIKGGGYKKALLIQRQLTIPVWFQPDEHRGNCQGKGQVTAKLVAQAIKDGTITSELLQAEKLRLEQREARAKEIDKEKVQQQVYEAFCARVQEQHVHVQAATSDAVCARFLVYEALGYSGKSAVHELLVRGDNDAFDAPALFHRLAALSDAEYSFLIRLAMSRQAGVNHPRTPAAQFLYQCAKDAGVGVTRIEQEQEDKAANRQKLQQDKLDALDRKLNALLHKQKA